MNMERRQEVTAFTFPESFGDARLEEVKLLSALAQASALSLSPPAGPWRDMVGFLVWHECLTTYSYDWAKSYWEKRNEGRGKNLTDGDGSRGMLGDSLLERSMNLARLKATECLYRSEPVLVQLTHPGRVRLSELKEALRSGRQREPFGILWDVRHWERDLQIAILDAQDPSPLSVAYLDMNGLKQVNDTYGHDVGDIALRMYMQAISSAVGDRAQAYRLGGDEVLLIAPGQDTQSASKMVELASRNLMAETLGPMEKKGLLSISAGITSTTERSTSHISLRADADRIQYRAKQQSKTMEPRPSVIAINGQEQSIM